MSADYEKWRMGQPYAPSRLTDAERESVRRHEEMAQAEADLARANERLQTLAGKNADARDQLAENMQDNLDTLRHRASFLRGYQAGWEDGWCRGREMALQEVGGQRRR